jgi:hypothetical protein
MAQAGEDICFKYCAYLLVPWVEYTASEDRFRKYISNEVKNENSREIHDINAKNVSNKILAGVKLRMRLNQYMPVESTSHMLRY